MYRACLNILIIKLNESRGRTGRWTTVRVHNDGLSNYGSSYRGLYMGGIKMKLVLVLPLIALAGCGHDKNAPPSNEEISKALQERWSKEVTNQDGAVIEGLEAVMKPTPYKQLLAIEAAEKHADEISRDSPFGKLYSVTITIKYHVIKEFQYRCDPKSSAGIAIQLAMAPHSPNFPLLTKGKHEIKCSERVQFTKVDQGWLLSSDYLIRR